MKKIVGLMTMAAVMLLISVTAFAATANPLPTSPGYMVMPLVFDRNVAAVSTPVIARIKMPFPAKVVAVQASCETADYASTDETYKIDVLEGATSILSAPIDMVAADTIYSGTVSDSKVADEAVVTVTLDVAGTTPSVTDVTVLLVLKRL
jgi:hypothetical protein